MEINKVVCIDNLEFMKQLDNDSIDLIYGDILFGTGKKFKDYQDLKADRKVINDFYVPRIKEMHRLLKSTGSIYLQMDWRINHWVRCIMDDIFGYENFRNEIDWYYSNKISRNTKNFPKNKDNILFYSKSKDNIFNVQKEIRDIPIKVSKREWRDNKNMRARDEEGNVIYEMSCDRTIDDVWKIPIIGSTSKERTGYYSQKPLALMERIIKASSNEGNLLADFFMGSGSFLVKAKELKRNYIGCDINPNALEIANLGLLS